jgi:hypothetical protein
MADVKELCGKLVVDDNNVRDGDATITFQPPAVAGDATGDLYETGEGKGKPFLERPCATISLTKTTNIQEGAEFEIQLQGATATQLQVTWDAKYMDLNEFHIKIQGMTEE